MALVRRGLIVVVTTVTALAGAFDGCLLDCHLQPPARDVQTAGHTHCHPAGTQQTGVRMHADPVCHHDHTSAAAESTARNRLDSRVLGIIESLPTRSDRPAAAIVAAIESTADSSGPTVALAPLRV